MTTHTSADVKEDSATRVNDLVHRHESQFIPCMLMLICTCGSIPPQRFSGRVVRRLAPLWLTGEQDVAQAGGREGRARRLNL